MKFRRQRHLKSHIIIKFRKVIKNWFFFAYHYNFCTKSLVNNSLCQITFIIIVSKFLERVLFSFKTGDSYLVPFLRITFQRRYCAAARYYCHDYREKLHWNIDHEYAEFVVTLWTTILHEFASFWQRLIWIFISLCAMFGNVLITEIIRSTSSRILRLHRFRPYYIPFTQTLIPEDFPCRFNLCTQARIR